MHWKDRLKKVDQLVGQSNGMLFDRLGMLLSIRNDPAYKEDCKSTGRSELELLSQKVCDVAMSLHMLFDMLSKFPKKQQWISGSLHQMQMVVFREQAKSKGGQKRLKKSQRQTATVSEVRELTNRVEKSELKAESAENKVRSLEALIAEKDSRIKDLEAALSQARETIGSLNETISLFKLQQRKRAVAAK